MRYMVFYCYFVLLSIVTLLAQSDVQLKDKNKLRIDVRQGLHFGDVLIDAHGGQLALTEERVLIPLDAYTKTIAKSNPTEAWFNLYGPPNASFNISVEPKKPILMGSRGGSIQVEKFIVGNGGYSGTFDDTGHAVFRLGAKIDIPKGSVSGLYRANNVMLQMSVPFGERVMVYSWPFSISCQGAPILVLTNKGPLEFGNLIPAATTEDYRVPPVGPAQGVPAQLRGAPRSAEFYLEGTPGTDFTVILPSIVWLDGPNGSKIKIYKFESNIPREGVQPQEGFSFKVGASVEVQPNQHPGRYEGIFKVSINYK